MLEQNDLLTREMQNYRKYLTGKTIFCDSDAPGTAQYSAYLRSQSAAWDIAAVLGRADVEHLDFDGLIACADVFILTPDDGRYQAFLSKVVAAGKGFIIVGKLSTAMYRELSAMLHQPLMVGANTFALL
ncbi:MAG: hypothetical protein IKN81_00495 [Oscillospiraceae bacterium]|nr:hypothetical protein [Oscillospiraceae bacterium]